MEKGLGFFEDSPVMAKYLAAWLNFPQWIVLDSGKRTWVFEDSPVMANELAAWLNFPQWIVLDSGKRTWVFRG